MHRSHRSVARGYAVRVAQFVVHALTALALGCFLLFVPLALFVAPAPNPDTAHIVAGELVSFTPPHPGSSDLVIRLDDQRIYYVDNVHTERNVRWHQLLNDVRPGDALELTVVTSLFDHLVNSGAPDTGRIAGIRTTTQQYMDPAVAAATWPTQARLATNARTACVALLLAFALSGYVAHLRNRSPVAANVPNKGA